MDFAKTPAVNPYKGKNPKRLGVPEPTEYGSDRWVEQMDEVLDVASAAARDEYPAVFFRRYGLPAEVPDALVEHVVVGGVPSGRAAAQMVRMDHPFHLLLWLHVYLARAGIKWRSSKTPDGAVDFIGAMVYPTVSVGYKILRAFIATFKLKWLWMVQRPEEWHGCNMTAYAEGCPGHPGDPAGHGADAGATVAGLLDLLEDQMTPDQIKQLVDAGLVFASYRTLAGVHRQVENVRGFIVGWAVARRVSYADAESQIREFVPDLVTA